VTREADRQTDRQSRPNLLLLLVDLMCDDKCMRRGNSKQLLVVADGHLHNLQFTT